MFILKCFIYESGVQTFLETTVNSNRGGGGGWVQKKKNIKIESDY